MMITMTQIETLNRNVTTTTTTTTSTPDQQNPSSSSSSSPNSLYATERQQETDLDLNGHHHHHHLMNGSASFKKSSAVNGTTTNGTSNNLSDIKVQVFFCGDIMVVYIREAIRLNEFVDLIRDICKFDKQQLFTIKWVDEEGDPCTLSSQIELDEAIRLYNVNKESELTVHVFPNIPERPGTQCTGEDRSIYRRGARRWRKLYLVNGHKYQAKRFARTALCKVCNDRIWGLGRQGYKCLECKTMVHKRCHKFINLQCSEILAQQATQHQQQQQQSTTPLTQSANNSIVNTGSFNSNCPTNHISSSFIDDLKQAQKHKQALRQQQQQSNKSTKSKTESIASSTSSSNGKQQQHESKSNGLTKALSTPLTSLFSSSSSNKHHHQQQQQQQSHSDIDPNNQLTAPMSVISKATPSSSTTTATTTSTNNNSTTTTTTTASQQRNSALISTETSASSNIDRAASNGTRQMSMDDFDLLRVIGRGSYAKVFLVEYKRTRKCYAMKVIKKSTVNDDEDIDWVQTEKHVFEQATNHPFLVGLHSCFQTDSRLFFVIEYLCGGDLMYHMQRKRRLPEDHARFYSAEISVALDFLHSRGIIYRDLKLDNVLLDIEGHIKLTDYGMCKEGLSRCERTSTFCGTPNYIAPEMLRGEDYDFSIDWWALGVLMYEMMAGRSPFEPVNENPGDNPDLNTEDHLFQVILEKPIRIPRSLSVKAASVLKGFLQKSPTERLASKEGLEEIKQHQFFKLIDWDLLSQRLIQPPYKPQVQNERDLTNIDELFTREPVVLTPETPRKLARIQQNEFEGFEYINPLILSDEIPV